MSASVDDQSPTPAPAPKAGGTPLLAVKGLNVHYGSAHVLQGVDFEMGHEPVSIIGRNGMGKTTLCNAIMQVRPARSRGSIVFDGTELVADPELQRRYLGVERG